MNAAEDWWPAQPAEPPRFGQFVAHRVHANPDIFVAIDHESAEHLLLALPDDAVFADDRSRGIQAVAHRLRVQERSEASFLDVRCTDAAGGEMFRTISREIVAAVRIGVSPIDSVQITLSRWRRFWGDVPEAGLTLEQVRGLFGELWFLLYWLLPHGQRHVGHWRGPEGARHDFQWPGRAIESKTTNSVRGHVHRINGVDQLTPPDHGTLHLFSLRIRDEPSAMNSLVSLVEQVHLAIAGNAALADELDLCLARAGYSPLHADRYREQRFFVIDERLYRVDADFPRLTPASLIGGVPVGIERIDYDLNLESADAFCVARRPVEMPHELAAEANETWGNRASFGTSSR